MNKQQKTLSFIVTNNNKSKSKNYEKNISLINDSQKNEIKEQNFIENNNYTLINPQKKIHEKPNKNQKNYSSITERQNYESFIENNLIKENNLINDLNILKNARKSIKIDKRNLFFEKRKGTLLPPSNNYFFGNMKENLSKRYSNIRNIIQDRTNENSDFLSNVFSFQKEIYPKIKKNQEKNVEIKFNLKKLKFFKIWMKFTRRKHYLKRLNKLKSNSFFDDYSIMQKLKLIFNSFFLDDLINKMEITNKNFFEFANDNEGNILIIENDLKKIITQFFNKLNSIIDNYNLREIFMSKDGEIMGHKKEKFIKQRTFSLYFGQIPHLSKFKDKNIDKQQTNWKKFFIYSLSRLIQEVYSLNVGNIMRIIKVKYFKFLRLYFLFNT